MLMTYIDENLHPVEEDNASKVWLFYKCLEEFEFSKGNGNLIIEHNANERA